MLSGLGFGTLMVPGEERLSVSITMFAGVQHDKRRIQVPPFLAVLGITAGAAGLTTSLTTDSKFIKDLQPVAQTRAKQTHWPS